MKYVLPILIFLGFGVLFGVLLVVISRAFAVEVDERTEKITEALPHANCGACGYAGCGDYADAVVNKGAPLNACLPGGEEVAQEIGKIMGMEVSAKERLLPILHCAGDCENAPHQFTFDGTATCANAKRFFDGTKLCGFGCMGLGDCARACEKEVITIQNGLPNFCYEASLSCGRCAKACPNRLLTMVSAKKRVHVRCSNHDFGKPVMNVCQVSCIGCKKCEKACPFDAIHVQDHLAIIDYEKCRSCGLCAKECPRGCIEKEGKK